MDKELIRLGLVGKVEIYLLVLTSGESDFPSGSGALFTDALDPLRTLLNTRDARAKAALKQAEDELGFYLSASGFEIPRVRKFPIEPLGFALPLGWRISSTTRLMLDMQIGEWKRCKRDRKNEFMADCSIDQIQRELNRQFDPLQ